MLTTPQRSAHLVVQSQFLNTMVGHQFLNIRVGPQFLNTMVGPQFLSIRVGPQFLNTMVGPQFLSIMVGTQLNGQHGPISIPQLHLSASVTDKPSVCLHDPKSTTNWLFFKIFKFSRPSLPSMTSFTLQSHFLSGIYYDNCDCHIICARA